MVIQGRTQDLAGGGGGAFLFIFGNLLEAMHFARGVLGHGVYLDQILS